MKIVFGGAKQAMAGNRLDEWRAAFPEAELVVPESVDEQIAAATDADAWIGRISREAFLAAGPRLRWVHSTGAGIEKLTAIPELVDSDVLVTNTRGSHAACVAEHAFAMLLALSRRIPDIVRNQDAERYANPGVAGGLRELAGSTMTVVGFGNLGRAVARRAVAFDMEVVGVDAFPGTVPDGVRAVHGLDRLDEALAETDVLVVAAPLTAETRHLIDARCVALLRPGAFLLAISRGGVIDDEAVVAALRSGHLGGAGLDVQEREPLPPGDPMWTVPNLLISPHAASTSAQTTQRVWDSTLENLRRFLRGEALENVCDTRAGF